MKKTFSDRNTLTACTVRENLALLEGSVVEF